MAKLLNCFRKLPQNSGQNSPQKETEKNSRVLLGNLRHCEPKYRRLFELALPENATKGDFLFSTLDPSLPPCKVRTEGQPFPQWKVQRDFLKLRFKQRKRLKQKKIYVQPIGPFPEFVMAKIGGLNFSLFEILCEFVSTFYLGFEVLLKDVVNLDELSCTTRIHAGTGKRQVLVKDVLLYVQNSLPSNGFAVIGITWEDMYPVDEWNFTLGEASSIEGCAAMCFGRYEPNESQRIKHQNKKEKYEGSRDISSKNKQHCSKEEEMICASETCLENAVSSCDQSEENDIGSSKNQGGIENERKNEHLECESDVDKSLKDERETIIIIDKIDTYQIWKFFRVISHELGHVFGLAHCVYFSCAMNESSSIQEAVNQPLFMCPICLKKIQSAAGFDIVERYHKLKFLLEVVHDGLLKGDGNGKDSEYGLNQKTLAENNSLVKDSLQKFACAIQWLESVLKFLDNEKHQ